MTETTLHQQVINYIKIQYPKILFRTDFAAGIKMTIGQAVKHKKIQKCRAWPDIFIAEPRGPYAGLFLEIKTDISEVFKKDLTLKADEHIQEQAEIINILMLKGYAAYFGCGFENCKRLIDEYMSQKSEQIKKMGWKHFN